MKLENSNFEQMTINERIKWFRNYRHKTQEEAAKLSKMSRANFASIEIGRIGITDRSLEAIADGLGASIEWLRTGIGRKIKASTREEEITQIVGEILTLEDDNFKKRLISMLANLDEEDWKMLEDASNVLRGL